MAANRPLTDDELEQIRQGNAAGQSLNSIAKRLGRSPNAIHVAAKRLGLSWDRSGVEAANAARAALGKERRQALQDRALSAAEKVYDTIEASKYKRIFKGEYGAEDVREIDFIPPNERRDLAATATQHVAISIRLAAVDDDSGVVAGASMLTKLAMDLGGALATDIATKIELNAGRTDG